MNNIHTQTQSPASSCSVSCAAIQFACAQFFGMHAPNVTASSQPTSSTVFHKAYQPCMWLVSHASFPGQPCMWLVSHASFPGQPCMWPVYPASTCICEEINQCHNALAQLLLSLTGWYAPGLGSMETGRKHNSKQH
jgi:hypothetical protein